MVSLTNFTVMIKVSLEYNYDKNSWRNSETPNSEDGWKIIDYCDKDLADSFIEKMNSVSKSEPLLRFKNIDSLRLLFKDHRGQFLAEKKSKQYGADGKNIDVEYI